MNRINELSPVIRSLFRWGFEYELASTNSDQAPVEILEDIAKEPSLYIRTAKLLQWRNYVLENEEPETVRYYEDKVEWPHGRPLFPSTYKNPLGIIVEAEDTEAFQKYSTLLTYDTIHQATADKLPQAAAEEITSELSQYSTEPVTKSISQFQNNKSQAIAALKEFRDDILERHAFFEMDQEFIEMDFLKDTIIELKAAWDAAIESGTDKPSLNLALTGESGSGKSVVTAFIAVAFHRFGMLPTNNVVRVSLSEISDTTHGGKEKALQEKFDEAENGLILFDETDTVASFVHAGQDRSVISQTINYQAGLTDANRSVVVATYPGSMDRFLDSDDGLRSRFRVVHFPERDTRHYVEVLANKLSNAGLSLNDDSLKRDIWEHFSQIRKDKGKEHINGRTVREFASTLHGIILKRTRAAGEDLATIIDDGYDIPVELSDIKEAIRREQAPKPEPIDVYKEINPYGENDDTGEDAPANVVVELGLPGAKGPHR